MAKVVKGLESQMESGLPSANAGKPGSKGSVTVNVGSRSKGKGVKVKRDFSPKGKGFNDPSWYAKNPQLLKDAASLAFANFQGVVIHETGTGAGYSFAPDSIFTLNYVPTLGVAATAVDALNIAVRNIYSFVRHANSGHSNYEPADLGIYLFAVTEIYGMIAHLERVYGISRVYSVKNRNLPKQLLTALGIDADDILNNQAQFRFNINRLIEKVASLCIPKGMSLLERRIWMNSFTFKDADTDKAALYQFRPSGFYRYKPTALSTGGVLDYMYWTNAPQSTAAQLISDVEQCIDAVLSDEDMNIMSGDILKAYQEGNLCKIAYIPEDYISVPVYQAEVLPQIHNCVVAGANPENSDSRLRSRWYIDPQTSQYYDYSFSSSGIFIQQYDSILRSEFFIGEAPSSTSQGGWGYFDNNGQKAQRGAPVPIGKHLIDEPMDSPEPADVMVATRLHPGFKITASNAGGTNYNTIKVDSCGSEIVTEFWLFRAQSGAVTINDKFGNSVYCPRAVGGNPDFMDFLFLPIRFSQYDMFPIFYFSDLYNMNIGTTDFDCSKFAFSFIFGDIYNFTTITDETLYKMHTTAVLSEVSTGTLFADK